jgi:hypothetical protein
VGCAGIAGGLAGLVGNPSEVCPFLKEISKIGFQKIDRSNFAFHRSIFNFLADCFGPHVRRRGQSSRTEICLLQRDKWNPAGGPRGGPWCILQRFGSKCGPERSNE